MQPVPIVLNYSLKGIRNDVRQKIIMIIHISKIAIEHTSVGLAHARPNKLSSLNKFKIREMEVISNIVYWGDAGLRSHGRGHCLWGHPWDERTPRKD